MSFKEKAKMLWPIRKGCMSCLAPLKTPKEKFTRTCTSCASKAAEGFELMGKGKFKQGLKQVLDTRFAKDDTKKQATEEKMGVALSKRKNKIVKKLKKQGLNDEEIEKGLEEYEKHMGRINKNE
jgi:hypothetical protein